VVAAGWAVDDAAAKLFAETFYRAMLDGVAFGRAVHRARAAVYTKYENTVNTWGAYQCYGDPDYRLIDRETGESNEDEVRFVSEAEAVVEVDNLYQYALSARAGNVPWLKQRLPKVEKAALAQWPESGSLHAALGRAYGELDMFEEAIRNYEAALANEAANVDLRALEQLTNLKARQAEVLARKACETREKNTGDLRRAYRLIDEAEDLLEKLIQLSPSEKKGRTSTQDSEVPLSPTETVERYSLKGSLYRRRAMIAAHEGRDEYARSLLRQVGEYYAKAEQITRRRDSPIDVYLALQQILAKTLEAQGKLSQKDRVSLLEKLRAMQDAAEARKNKTRDFWTRANLADCILVRALIEGDLLEEGADDIVELYRDAQARGVSLREWRSVLENLEFIRVLIRSQWSKSLQSAVMQALTLIYRGLEFFVDGGEIVNPPQSERLRPRRAKK
jgi:tetratricopeptide (TPR) repeat protein